MNTEYTIFAFITVTAALCCLPSVLAEHRRFETKDFYPKFSWGTTPIYFMFGDSQRTLLPEEVEFIAARTDFLCIEKSHGHRSLGAAELGAKHEAAAFKKIKPDIKVLFYFNSAYAWPFTSYNRAFSRTKIDQYKDLKDFLLVDPDTGQLAHRRNIEGLTATKQDSTPMGGGRA